MTKYKLNNGVSAIQWDGSRKAAVHIAEKFNIESFDLKKGLYLQFWEYGEPFTLCPNDYLIKDGSLFQVIKKDFFEKTFKVSKD